DVPWRPGLGAVVVRQLDQADRALLDDQGEADPAGPRPLLDLLANAWLERRVAQAELAMLGAGLEHGQTLGPVGQVVDDTAPAGLDAAGLAHGQHRQRVGVSLPRRDRALAGTLDRVDQALRQGVSHPGHRERAGEADGQAVQHLQLPPVAVAPHAASRYVRLPWR